jgi:Ca2+-transporting ATPase
MEPTTAPLAMASVQGSFGEILFEVAALLAATYLIAVVLARFRIPPILGALLIGMIAAYTPLGDRLQSPELGPLLGLLAELGLLVLLFFIGLHVDIDELRQSRGDIVWCTVLNTALPFLLGVVVMLTLGYGWGLALIIGLTRMPTAEAVVVPILDEFQMIRTKVGNLIVGAGTLDDVIEVFLVGVVSVWVGQQAGNGESVIGEVGAIGLALAGFLLIAWLTHRYLAPHLARWLPRRPRNLMFLSIVVLFAFGGYTELTHLGVVIGAITAGIVMRRTFNAAPHVGEQVSSTIQSLSYGFLGLIFFLWVGLSVDLRSILDNPMLILLLYLAGTLGKLGGVFLMVPMGRLTVREAWVVGVGLDARLTTEIIVAKLLLDTGLIGTDLFTALVTAASITAVTVPVAFTVMLRQWGDALRHKEPAQQPQEVPHVS